MIPIYTCAVGDGNIRYTEPSGRVLLEVSSATVSQILVMNNILKVCVGDLGACIQFLPDGIISMELLSSVTSSNLQIF